MHIVKIILVVLLLALVSLFTFQNTAVTEVRFFFWTASLSVSLMLLAALFFGIFIGLFLAYAHTWRKNRRLKNSGIPGSSFAEADNR